ncbi:nucleotide exchange factor GrpE [Engelhardtia mirabilis]|uniref:Protein GrpE n=1 Tax=Engelhardtia mirabilis TaxID=2528011 RepID=A0A518BM75_9BACT|nr:heat shock protein GrpE [Planctomycetes bacterium Pla133]QDV02406.1 heat shock protein GrpE [Planctomycetes bacterium Pla86]
MTKNHPDTTNGEIPVDELEPLEREPHSVEDPAAPESAQESGDDSLESLRAQRDEYLGHWQRAQADYQNLKRRSSTDVENRLRRTMEPLLRNLLLVIDHLDMALMSPAQSQDAQNLAMGVELVRRQMATALEESDVEPIADGGSFDPELHQAVARVQDPDAEPNTVLETVRRGYTWRGRVLRHAEVRVAAEAGGDSSDPDSEG